MMRGFIISLFLALAFGSFAAELKLPPYTRTTLSNGVILFFMEQHEVPMVSFSVLVSAGSTSDPKDKEGLASLASELLTRGTTSRSAERIASDVDFLGGALQFSTGLDFTSGGAEFLAKDSGTGVELLSDVLLNPVFSQEEVTK